MSSNGVRGVLNSEMIGRRVHSASACNSARRGTTPWRLFDPPKADNELSVDRLDLVSHNEAVAMADDASLNREGKFCGWVTFSAAHARRHNCRVEPDPTPLNPAHANVVIPESAMHDANRRREIAKELAKGCQFRGR